MKKVLVIAGPTAVGKSEFAVNLALKYGLSIISGDSIQVYRGLDIGSGKITKEEMKGVRHYLIDILSPKESYSVSDFQRMARAIIDASEKPVMICGGTGLYLKACLYDYSFDENEGELPSADPELEKLDDDTLYAMLVKSDPVQAEKIHPHNRRRVLRSLTIQKRTGKTQSEIEKEQSHTMLYDTLILGCTMERKKLYERINARVEGMFHKGLEQEVRGLLDQGVTFEDTCMEGIGYREWKGYFTGEMSEEEVKTQIQTHSRQFAKRQYTWLKHQMPVDWFNITDPKDTERVLKETDVWLKG